MTIQSRGVLRGIDVKTPSVTIWQGTTSTWNVELLNRWVSYAAIYRDNETVAAVIDKLARATARLPLKVYQRADLGRPEARTHPYAALLRSPSRQIDPFTFWVWTVSTLNLYGEAFWGKVRDSGGRPVELVPLHPVGMHYDEDTGRWRFDTGKVRVDNIRRDDLVHFRFYNPDDTVRGLSPLESLRQTLANTDAARRAQQAFWRNGGRPSVVLTTPSTLKREETVQRLRMQWNDIHAGADNFGKVAILEEGLTPEVLSLSAEEAQYIEGRKLDREEVLIRFDMPPPVLHILDHATFSNIVEQMRSMYRDTMAPRLKHLESVMEFELRRPDFGDEVYAEFLLDEVLRGDFEQRVDSYQKGVNSGWLTPAEVRNMENLPFVEGSDRLFVNSTMVPIETAATPALPAETVRSLMGRLSRQKDLGDVDQDALVAGLNGEASVVLAALEDAKHAGDTIPAFRDRLRALGGS